MVKNSELQASGQARARRVARLSFICAGPSRAKQNFKAECDINTIMKKFEKQGVIDHVKNHAGRYGDFLNAPANYHEAATIVAKANEMFASLPAKVRKAFDNDPQTFLQSVEDARAGNQDAFDRLHRLGLLETTAQPAPAGAPPGPAGEPETPPEGGKTPAKGDASQ